MNHILDSRLLGRLIYVGGSYWISCLLESRALSDQYDRQCNRAPHFARSSKLFTGNENPKQKKTHCENDALRAWVRTLPPYTNKKLPHALYLLLPTSTRLTTPDTSRMWVQHASTETNQRSRYPMLIYVCSVMVLTMIAVVALRAYDRAHRAKHFRLDDWTTFTSAVCLSVLFHVW